MKRSILIALLMIIASLGVYSFAANSTIDNAIAWFYSNGLTTKNTATTFKADQGLRRDEAAKFFVGFAKILGKTGYVKSDKECTFSDIKNSWADLKGASVEACKLGLFQGNNGKFNPQQQVTNAQAITVLVRLLAGSQSEIGTHRADSYYAKADELHILNNVKMNNKNDTATRGNVAIIIYNSRDSKTNTTGIKDITGGEDSQETILAYINNKRNKINDCNVKIGNIDTLNKEITNRTGGIIEKMMIQNACGKTNEYSSTLTLTGLTLKQNNNKYTIYSLIDKNWDFAYNEYPVIVFDKTKGTNKLLTIRSMPPELTYLDNEGNILIKSGNYGEGGDTSIYVFNISQNRLLGQYTIPWTDCGDQALSINKEKTIILHNFNAEICAYDYDTRNLEEEKKLVGILTYKDKIDPLGKFNKNSKLNATNQDILEGVKSNKLIFHIDNNKYELTKNTLTIIK